LLAACSTPGTGVRADISKLRSWSADLSSAQPLPPPFVADFEQGARSLTYVAIEHSREKDSPSLGLLRRVMAGRRYAAVLLEGLPRALGASPDVAGGKGYFRSAETIEAAAIAGAKKIPWFGAEPTDSQLREAVLAAGYTAEDLFGFHVLRLIPQWKLDGTLTRETFEDAYAQVAPSLAARAGLDKPLALDAFRAWYAGRLGTSFKLRDVRADTTAPLPNGALFAQKLAFITDRVRSVHILRVTEEVLNKFGRVLLVFHSAHFPVQEPALESMLGPPVRISDQP
jgi:hypothetical protein